MTIKVPVTTATLAKFMERDRARQTQDCNSEPVVSGSSKCVACGRSFSRGVGRFCSEECREAYDRGFPAHQKTEPQYFWCEGTDLNRPDMYRPMPISGQGFALECVQCKQTFFSKGLRCCSDKCERKLKEAQEIAETLETIRAEPIYVHRKCEQCGRDIPRYTGTSKNRRLTPAGTRFCSRRCRDRAARHASSKSEKTPIWTAVPESPPTVVEGPQKPA
jgi:predicted nucleic acid-binding Zn ribbon protein